MQNRPISASLRQKQPRLTLAKGEYEIVRKRVLERDSWRCQECGSMQNLHVHHMKRRSQHLCDAPDRTGKLAAQPFADL